MLDIYFYFEISPKVKIHIKLKYDTFVEHFMKHMFLFSEYFKVFSKLICFLKINK